MACDWLVTSPANWVPPHHTVAVGLRAEGRQLEAAWRAAALPRCAAAGSSRDGSRSRRRGQHAAWRGSWTWQAAACQHVDWCRRSGMAARARTGPRSAAGTTPPTLLPYHPAVLMLLPSPSATCQVLPAQAAPGEEGQRPDPGLQRGARKHAGTLGVVLCRGGAAGGGGWAQRVQQQKRVECAAAVRRGRCSTARLESSGSMRAPSCSSVAPAETTAGAAPGRSAVWARHGSGSAWQRRCSCRQQRGQPQAAAQPRRSQPRGPPQEQQLPPLLRCPPAPALTTRCATPPRTATADL